MFLYCLFVWVGIIFAILYSFVNYLNTSVFFLYIQSSANSVHIMFEWKQMLKKEQTLKGYFC